MLAAVNQGGSSPSGPAGQPPRRRRRSPRDLVVYFVCCGAGRGARNVPTCCNWGRLRRLTCRKKNMEFRRAFPRRLQRGAVTSVCLNAPIGSRSCRFDGARGWASLFWSYVVAARAHLSLAFADPARNAACGLLPVLICRSQAGSSELEQSEYAFSHLLLALTCCAALSPLHFVGSAPGCSRGRASSPVWPFVHCGCWPLCVCARALSSGSLTAPLGSALLMPFIDCASCRPAFAAVRALCPSQEPTTLFRDRRPTLVSPM